MQTMNPNYTRNTTQTNVAYSSYLKSAITLASVFGLSAASNILPPRQTDTPSNQAPQQPREHRAILEVASNAAQVEGFEIGRYATPGTAYDIALQQNQAFIAAGNEGLQVLDITDLSNPILAGSYNTTGFSRQVSLDTNNRAYLADDNQGVRILDISNVAGITEVGSYVPTEPVTKLRVVGDKLILSNNNQPSLEILSAGQNPADVIGIPYSTTRGVTDIYTLGNEAYIAYPGFGVTRIDATRFPKIHTLPLDGNTIRDTTVMGQYSYIAADTGGLYIIDKTDPRSPQQISQLSVAGTAYGIMVYNNRAYLAAGSAGIHIIDISNPAQPTLISSFDTPDTAKGIYIQNTLAYVADSAAGLHIIDISNETAPQLLGTFDSPGIAEDVYVGDRVAYLADGDQGLQLVDIRLPSQPKIFGQLNHGGYTKAVSLNDIIACIADGNQGLAVIDVSDPNTPRLLGEHPSTNALGVYIDGETVYLSDDTDGLRVFDITRLSAPELLAQYDTIGSAQGLSAANGYAYVADGTAGLHIIEAPLWQGRLPKPTTAMQVAASSTHTYVATFERILHILDSSDIENPIPLATYNMTGSARDMLIDGDFVYIAEGKDGIEIINIKDKQNPAPAGQLTTGITNARGLARQNNHLLIADDTGGFIIYQTNTQPLIDSNQLITYSGQTKILGIDNLHAIDADNPATELTFTISNLSNGQFENNNNPGIPITRFTLDDIENARIQIVHDGSATAPNYQVSVTDGRLSDGPYSPLLFFNEPPVWLTNQLTLEQNQHVNITTHELNAELIQNIQIPYNPASLEYQITQSQNGHFALNTAPNTPLTVFTQQNILDGQLIFIHDGGENAPDIQIALSNGAIIDTPVAFNVTFININDPPVIVANQLIVNQGQAVVITLNDIRAQDVDNDDASLQFDVNRMGHGNFGLLNVENVISARFTQQQIGQGQIQFTHTGDSQDIPFYEIAVTDGELGTAFIQGSVDFNAAPQLINNRLTLGKGESVAITPDNLQATDADDDDTSLQFEIVDLSHGHFEYITQPNIPQTNFSQQRVINGDLRFIHDSSNESPQYGVSVRDKRMLTPNQTADVIFNNQDSVDNTAVIAGSAVAGGIGLCALAAGIGLFAKNRKERNTREKHQLARYLRRHLKLDGYANFNSTKGREYVDLVEQDLTRELQKQGFDPNTMSDRELENLAKRIATATQQQILSETTFFGRSKLTPHAIKPHIPSIVQALLQAAHNPLTGEASHATLLNLDDEESGGLDLSHIVPSFTLGGGHEGV